MSTITEIAPDVYKISIFVPQADMQFNHFVILDDEPVLYHTGSRSLFPQVRDALNQVLPPDKLRWIGFSHFESDECGALNEWHELAPAAQAFGTLTAITVNFSSFAVRLPKPMLETDLLTTGRHTFRMIPTPHLPHGWDAGMFFDETHRILFCSDLFHHNGDPPAITHESLLEPVRRMLLSTQSGPLRDYIPYTTRTDENLRKLAGLLPRFLATQHGSTFVGDGAQELIKLGAVIKEASAYSLSA